MVKRQNIKSRGNVSLGRYFQGFEEGDIVSVDMEKSIQTKFPKRLQGRTGKVIGKQGNAYVVKIKDQTKEKSFIINPINLKKLKKIQ